MRKGSKMSLESREKMRLSHLGKQPMLGKKFSEGHKRKLSEYRFKNPVKFWLGKKLDDKHKSNISLSRKGMIFSGKTRNNMSLAHTGKPRFDLKGKKHSKEWRENIRSGLFNKLKIDNPDYIFSDTRKERIIKNGGFHSLGEWETLKAQYNWTCPSCKKSEPEIKLTRDHIIPILKGGSDNIENIQPLCKSCNSKKHTKTIKY